VGVSGVVGKRGKERKRKPEDVRVGWRGGMSVMG